MIFSSKDIPSLKGKTAFITGGNTGLGFECASVLSQKGATVFILCRNKERGKEALSKLSPNVKLITLDLSNTKNLKNFTDTFCNQSPHSSTESENNTYFTPSHEFPQKLDILINNAGIMNIPKRTLTTNGIEKQMAINHFAHFILTIGLLPLLKKSDSPRVITVSSIAAYNSKLDFKNINSQKNYKPYSTYKTSKLLNILFANELGRRYKWLTSVAAHPGIVNTNIFRYTQEPFLTVLRVLKNIFGHSVHSGALPMIYAATMVNVKTGMFFGPRYMVRGPVAKSKQPYLAKSIKNSKTLWDVSKKLTQN